MKLKIGDEVKNKKTGSVFVVWNLDKKHVIGFCNEGNIYACPKKHLVKTGRYFPQVMETRSKLDNIRRNNVRQKYLKNIGNMI